MSEMARALALNQQRLVSPFDVHATLRHFLSYPRPPAAVDWSDTTYNAFHAGLRPQSILSEVDAARTCYDAGVPDDSCRCERG